VRSDVSRKRSETLPISAPHGAATFVELVLVKTAYFRNAERFHSAHGRDAVMQDATRAQLCLTRLCEVTTPQLLLQLCPVVLRTSCCGAREPRSLAVAWWGRV
jgi:hypothetical protein